MRRWGVLALLALAAAAPAEPPAPAWEILRAACGPVSEEDQSLLCGDVLIWPTGDPERGAEWWWLTRILDTPGAEGLT